jgi:hypothetical protein
MTAIWLALHTTLLCSSRNAGPIYFWQKAIGTMAIC